MSLPTINQFLPFAISLSILTGVMLHDTRFDKFARAFLAVPGIATTYEGVKMNDSHTHTERLSVSQLARAFAYETPRTQARQDDKRYRLEKNVVKGHHPFDNYSLPVVA